MNHAINSHRRSILPTKGKGSAGQHASVINHRHVLIERVCSYMTHHRLVLSLCFLGSPTHFLGSLSFQSLASEMHALLKACCFGPEDNPIPALPQLPTAKGYEGTEVFLRKGSWTVDTVNVAHRAKS